MSQSVFLKIMESLDSDNVAGASSILEQWFDIAESGQEYVAVREFAHDFDSAGVWFFQSQADADKFVELYRNGGGDFDVEPTDHQMPNTVEAAPIGCMTDMTVDDLAVWMQDNGVESGNHAIIIDHLPKEDEEIHENKEVYQKTEDTDTIIDAVSERLGIDREIVTAAWYSASEYYGAEGADEEINSSSYERVCSLGGVEQTTHGQVNEDAEVDMDSATFLYTDLLGAMMVFGFEDENDAEQTLKTIQENFPDAEVFLKTGYEAKLDGVTVSALIEPMTFNGFTSDNIEQRLSDIVDDYGMIYESATNDILALVEEFKGLVAADKLNNKEGSVVGDGDAVKVNADSPVPSQGKREEGEGEPVEVKSENHKGFDLEKAPKFTEVKVDGKAGVVTDKLQNQEGAQVGNADKIKINTKSVIGGGKKK